MIYIVCFSAPRFSLLYASFCVSMCFLLSCCVPLLYALMCLNVYFGISWCVSPIRRWVHASWEPLYLPLASVQQQHIVSATSSNCRLLLGWHFHTTCSSSYLLIPWLFLLLIPILLQTFSSLGLSSFSFTSSSCSVLSAHPPPSPTHFLLSSAFAFCSRIYPSPRLPNFQISTDNTQVSK